MPRQQPETERALTWSYGGGTQSIAIAILIYQGRLPKPACIVMADTAREASETWEYHERYTAPLLAEIGLTVEIASHDLARIDLYDKAGTMLVPAFTEAGKLRTYCSVEWKARVIHRHLRSRGYGPDRPVLTWIGFSLDEIERMKHSDLKWQQLHWPLCYDVPLRRGECAALVRSFGWPDPPKSSCWMCPHRRNPQWRRLRDQYPADWQRAIALDREIRARDEQHALYLHYSRVPLWQAVLDEDQSVEQLTLGCDSGLCWT